MGMNNKDERIEEWAKQEILSADGFDDAIVGLARRSDLVVVAYSVDKMLKIMVDGGISQEDAREYFEYNIVDAWVGESTPVYIEDYKDFIDVEAKIEDNHSRQSAQDSVEPEEGDTGGGANGKDVQD